MVVIVVVSVGRCLVVSSLNIRTWHPLLSPPSSLPPSSFPTKKCEVDYHDGDSIPLSVSFFFFFFSLLVIHLFHRRLNLFSCLMSRRIDR